MCWDNDKKVQRRKRACCFAQTNPYQQTNLEGRGKACAMTRKWNRQRYILLWQPFQLKNKQNRTGHKLYANWYNQRINATVNIIWHHTRKCTSQEEKQKDAPTPPSEARRPRTPTTWILSNSINLHNTFYGATATQLLQDRSTPNTDTDTKTNPAAINYIVKFMHCWVHFLVHAYA